jgi:ankyrin repeat protein
MKHPRARLLALASAALLLGAVVAPPSLLDAAKAGDWSSVRELVQDGADVTARAPDGATALHWASYWDDVATAELLIQAGADARAANDLGATPLWLAALNGSSAMVRTLLRAGADPNSALLAGETPVMTAARTGSPEVLELLLSAGGDPNARGSRGQTALMWAASQGHDEAVGVLLRHGADVGARSDTWSQVMAVPPHSDPANQQSVPHGADTPLLFAARVGDVESARLLLESGANASDADAWAVSATVYAAHSGFPELVHLLLSAGADPDAQGAGFSALHMAVMRRDVDMARDLLAHGADANARLANWTPTRRASADWSIHPAFVGATPFWLAARLGEPAMMRLLAENGADPLIVHEVRYVGTSGTFGAEWKTEATTALMAAVGMGGPRSAGGYMDPPAAVQSALRLEAARVAIELGVDLAARDLEGRTAAEGTRDAALRGFLEESAVR